MINKGRANRPVRRMGTEVHEDRRTKRRRTRAAELQEALEESMEPLDLDDLHTDAAWEGYAAAWHDDD